MRTIKKLVAIQPVSLLPEFKEKIAKQCDETIFYDTVPENDQEMIRRIGDADAIFVSYTHEIGESILSACPNLKYIGMCCSLYSEASSNVDIAYARAHGIEVTGIRDCGDEGVAEYVISNLIFRLHGEDGHAPLLGEISEISGVTVGMLGMGASARAVVRGLDAFGADIRYYSRTRKPEIEASGCKYQNLEELLKDCDVICSCLSKNVTLLYEKEFEILGENKILFNTALSPCFEQAALEDWLDKKQNTWYYCDTLMGLGDESLLSRDNVRCQKRSSGMTKQAVMRLNEKVLANLNNYLMQDC